MKVPNKMDKGVVAICGMNCTVCYKHLITKKYAILNVVCNHPYKNEKVLQTLSL